MGERAARQRWNLVCVVEWICERLRPVHQRTRGSAKVEFSSVLWSGSVRDCGLCTKERAARQRWNLVCVLEWICERLRPVHQRTRGSAKVESRLCCGVDL